MSGCKRDKTKELIIGLIKENQTCDCMAHGPMAVLFNDDQSKYMGKFSCINSDVNCDTVFYRYLYVRVTV